MADHLNPEVNFFQDLRLNNALSHYCGIRKKFESLWGNELQDSELQDSISVSHRDIGRIYTRDELSVRDESSVSDG